MVRDLISVLILAMVAAGAAVAATPAAAQTYDPKYPVCKRTNSDAASIECYYNSMAECQGAVRGMSAECVANPYYAAAQQPAAAATRAPRHN